MLILGLWLFQFVLVLTLRLHEYFTQRKSKNIF